MEWEYKQLRVEYAGCQKSLRLCRKKLQTERNNFRKLILAVSDRLEQSSIAVRQVRSACGVDRLEQSSIAVRQVRSVCKR